MKEQLIERSKCKIIATVGPASSDAPIITKMIDAGLDVVRINFSHGTEDWHANLIEVIRDTSIKKRLLLPIMGDLPGPKIRLGKLNPSPILLTKGQKFVLTEEEIVGSWETASINLKGFTSLVKERDSIFINDGEVELIVERIDDKAIVCEVVMGGEIGSHKGVNLPNTELGIEIFTEADQRWVEFAAKHEIEILCQSFVSKPEDIKQLREYAAALGYKPFIIAKIERKLALKHLDGIIEEADGIMIARGDLGVELPLEQIPVFQRQIIHKAIIAGKPVITATQMLESMKINRRPTRAEVTDVAHAVWNGTDALMLSGETAVGKYPVEAIKMLSQISKVAEQNRAWQPVQLIKDLDLPHTTSKLIASSVIAAVERGGCAAVIVPTASGTTARTIARARLPVPIIAVTDSRHTAANLKLSYGVYPVVVESFPEKWDLWTREFLSANRLKGKIALIIQGPSLLRPTQLHRIEYLILDN